MKTATIAANRNPVLLPSLPLLRDCLSQDAPARQPSTLDAVDGYMGAQSARMWLQQNR
jgi:hypothetical protein